MSASGVVELRAAVALARLKAGDEGVTWSLTEWGRLWGYLTDLQRHVVYLHVLVGLTRIQVGEQLGIGRGAVDGAWKRALDRIRDVIPDRM